MFLSLFINKVAASIAFTIFLEQTLDKLGVGSDLLLIAIVAIDENDKVGSVDGHLYTRAHVKKSFGEKSLTSITIFLWY